MTSPGRTSPNRAGPDPTAASLNSVYEENFRYVWRCLKSLGVPDSQLDDAAQEVFMVVNNKLAEFDGSSNIRTWLYAIALRVARRARRSSAEHARRFVSSDPSADLADSPQNQSPLFRADMRLDVEKQERLQLARRALGTLDETKREIFVLMCIEGLSAPEVVRILGVPLNTVYSRLRTARQAFLVAAAELEHASSSAIRLKGAIPSDENLESANSESEALASPAHRARGET